MDSEKKKPETKKGVEEKKPQKTEETTYVMTVTHLSWGKRKMNHFYAREKPLISKKVMRNYADTLDLWIAKGWVKEGFCKK